MRVGIHEALPRYARQYGTVCKAFFGRSPIVIITDPDLVKQVWGPSLRRSAKTGILVMLRSKPLFVAQTGVRPRLSSVI